MSKSGRLRDGVNIGTLLARLYSSRPMDPSRLGCFSTAVVINGPSDKAYKPLGAISYILPPHNLCTVPLVHCCPGSLFSMISQNGVACAVLPPWMGTLNPVGALKCAMDLVELLWRSRLQAI